MTDAAKRIKQLEKGYDELRTVNNRLQALVEDVMDLGRDCAVSITGFPEDSAAIQLPANAIAAIKEELRLGRARHNEATEIEARLAEAERIVRAVDKVGAEAVANGGRITLTQGAVLFTAAANYLVKHHSAADSEAAR